MRDVFEVIQLVIERMRKTWTYFFPNPGYYGWVIVAVGFLCSALSGPGQSFAISLYIEHVMQALDIGRLEISSLYATMTLLAALCLPFVGRAADALSGRKFLGSVILVIGLAVAFFSQVQGIVSLAVAFFALRLLGQGSIGLGTLTLTVQWFKRYRARALAVVSLGYAAGEMVYPAIILGLIVALGWRESLWLLAAIYIFVFTPTVFLLLRERRQDEPIDGDETPEAEDSLESLSTKELGSELESEEPIYTFSTVTKMPTFWLMTLCVSVFPMVVTGLIFHQVAIFETLDWGARRIPAMFALFAATSMIISYAAGLILEHISSRYAVSASLMFIVLALASTILSMPATLSVAVYGILLGIASGLSVISNSVVWPEYYGIAALGTIKGVVTMVRNGSTALGPPLVAWTAGETLNFGASFLVFGIISGVGAALALVLRAPSK